MPKLSDINILVDILPNLLIKWQNVKHIVVGDFNINIAISSSLTLRYLNYIESCGFRIANDQVTRPISSTIIDHTIVNFGNVVSVTLENDVSDHNMVLGYVDDTFGAIETGRTEYSYNVIDYEQARISLQREFERREWETMSGEQMLAFIKSNLRTAIESNTTVKTYKKKTPTIR